MRAFAIAMLVVGLLVIGVYSLQLHPSILALFAGRSAPPRRRSSGRLFAVLTGIGILLVVISVWFLRAHAAR